jgi:hypothetical protein
MSIAQVENLDRQAINFGVDVMRILAEDTRRVQSIDRQKHKLMATTSSDTWSGKLRIFNVTTCSIDLAIIGQTIDRI